MSETETCALVLGQGGVVAAPTDTFYGLLADPFSEVAMGTLRRLKHESGSRPWPLLIPARFDLSRIGCTLSHSGRRLALRFWPGKVTLIVACEGPLASLAGRSRDGAVGLRVPGGPDALARMLELWDGPLTGTSANPAGSPPAESLEEVLGYFPRELGHAVAGSAPGGAPSTVVDTVANPVSIVRAGAVSEDCIREALS